MPEFGLLTTCNMLIVQLSATKTKWQKGWGLAAYGVRLRSHPVCKSLAVNYLWIPSEMLRLLLKFG